MMWNYEVAEVMKAFYEEHKPIQYTIANEWTNGSGVWHDIEAPNCDSNKYDYRINWDWNKYKYRIKPEDEIKKDTVWIVASWGKPEKIFKNKEDAMNYYYDAKMFCDPDDYSVREWSVN